MGWIVATTMARNLQLRVDINEGANIDDKWLVGGLNS